MTSFKWQDPILVEAKEGGFEEVCLEKQKCSCSEFAKQKSCQHLLNANKWLGKRWDRFLCLSALHKEIRRSDVNKAFSWARILLNHQSEKSLLAYLERICFEECRDIPLYLKLRKKELSLEQALEWMATTRKKWELDYLIKPSHFDLWFSGYEKSMSRPPPLPLELGQLVRLAQDPVDAYSLFFDLRRSPDLQPIFFSHLEEVAAQKKNERLLTYLKYVSNTSYSRMIGAELLVNCYDSQARDRHTSNRSERSFIPTTKPYHFDMHHSRGRAILIENFAKAWREKSFQFDELDLRFSGSLFGVLHRERTYLEKGSMKKTDNTDWNWDEVKINEGDYNRALSLETYYYSDVISKIKKRHPNLDLNGSK